MAWSDLDVFGARLINIVLINYFARLLIKLDTLSPYTI